MPISVNLSTQPNTTINAGNVGDGNVDLTLGSNGTLTFDGVNAIVTDTVGGGIVSNTTYKAIDGANVTLGSNVSGISAGSTTTYDIGANSSITQDLGTLNVSVLNGATVNFQNTGGTGMFAVSPASVNLGLLSSTPQINGLATGDKIEVIGANGATLSGNTLTFTYPSGLLGINDSTSFQLNNIPGGSTISFNASTGAVTFACFLRGTKVRTPHGEVAVEELRPGDEVLALKLGKATIKWIGRRQFDPRMIEDGKAAFPVRVCRHAIADNVPHRDLLLSPDHSLFFEGALIPVKLLINGSTIVQEIPDGPFEYFHIELDRHDVITAEGALAETYVDLGNRPMFGGPGVVQFVPRQAHDWSDYAFPPLYDGPDFKRVRAKIDVRAAMLARAGNAPANAHAQHPAAAVSADMR
jgi:hypothetical protein